MNLYRFVNRSKVNEPTAEDIATAKAVSSLEEFEQFAANAGEYQFNSDDNTAKMVQALASKAVSVHLWTEKLPNGTPVVRGEFKTANGKTYRFRTYGTKGMTMPETTITDAEKLKTLVWGVCYQDGALVDEMKTVNGRCVTYPVIYLSL